MNHPISPQYWVDYMDGELGAEESAEIERHLMNCGECMDLFCSLLSVDKALSSEAAALEPLAAILGKTLEQMIEEQAVRPKPLIRKLNRLLALMIPMCGRETAAQVLRAAVSRECSGNPGGVLDEAGWLPFLSAVTAQTSRLCGGPAARLVWETGQVA